VIHPCFIYLVVFLYSTCSTLMHKKWRCKVTDISNDNNACLWADTDEKLSINNFLVYPVNTFWWLKLCLGGISLPVYVRYVYHTKGFNLLDISLCYTRNLETIHVGKWTQSVLFLKLITSSVNLCDSGIVHSFWCNSPRGLK